MKALLASATILVLGSASGMAQEPAPSSSTAIPQFSQPDLRQAGTSGFSVGGLYGFNMEDSGDDSKSSHLAGLNLSYDYALDAGLGVSLEQAVFWNFLADQDGLGGRTAAGLDMDVGGAGGFVPRVGVNVGGIYGRGIEDSFFAGPEIGFNVFGFDAKVAYDMPFNRGMDDGIILATIGLGLRF